MVQTDKKMINQNRFVYFSGSAVLFFDVRLQILQTNTRL